MEAQNFVCISHTLFYRLKSTFKCHPSSFHIDKLKLQITDNENEEFCGNLFMDAEEELMSASLKLKINSLPFNLELIIATDRASCYANLLL